MPAKRTSKAKTVPKKAVVAEKVVTSFKPEVIDLDGVTGNNTTATTKRKQATTASSAKLHARSKETLPKTPILSHSVSVIDTEDSDEDEGSPTPKKETKKKKSASPPPGPFTADFPSSSQPVLSRRSSRLSTSPAAKAKTKVATPSIVLKDIATNRTVKVATDHAILLGRDDNAAMCIDDGYVSERFILLVVLFCNTY